MPVKTPCREPGCPHLLDAGAGRRCPEHERKASDFAPRLALHPFVDVARETGEHLLEITREWEVDRRTVKPLEAALASWNAGRVDPDGEDLDEVLLCIYRIGWHMGRANQQDPRLAQVRRMAAKRRSPHQPEIVRLLLAGKTNGQIEKALPTVSARTIDRVRAAEKKAGHLQRR